MSKIKQVVENKNFIGRFREWELLEKIANTDGSAIVVVYGRRRVGKTELIEQAYRGYRLIKFEGLEGANENRQRQEVLRQLSKYEGDPNIAKLALDTWIEVFEQIAKYTQKGAWIIYFEELQWLADYGDSFISELKSVWDNTFRYNNKLKMVLCGSAPSFMINKVMHSKALYNRSTHELPLYPFTLHEAQLFLKNRSEREIMDAYLTLGGIPEYLNQIKKESSIFIGICNNSFTSNGYFVGEYRRIFVSSLSKNKHYQKIIDYLSHKKYATRLQIANHLELKSGGQITDLLQDLIVSGFIECYSPYNQSSKSRLNRYCIKDNYLNFYFKFIEPIKNEIKLGDFNDNPTQALDTASYTKWLGFAFERFCRQNHRLIAKILEFSGVRYKCGAFFNRTTEKNHPGFQADLIYLRRDHVLTICEIKYLQGNAGTEYIQPFEDKLALINAPKHYTIQKVLITTHGASNALISRAYFDRVIVLTDLFKACS